MAGSLADLGDFSAAGGRRGGEEEAYQNKNSAYGYALQVAMFHADGGHVIRGFSIPDKSGGRGRALREFLL